MKKVLILLVLTLLVSGFVLSAAVHIGAFDFEDEEALPETDTNTDVGTDTVPDAGTDTDTGDTPEVDSFFDPLDVSTFDPARHENLLKFSDVSLAVGEVICDGEVYDTVVFASSSEYQSILFHGFSDELFMTWWAETNMEIGSVTFEPGYVYHCYYEKDGGYVRYNPTMRTDEETGEPVGSADFTLLNSAGEIVKFGSGLIVEETITATFYLGTGYTNETMHFYDMSEFFSIYIVRVSAMS